MINSKEFADYSFAKLKEISNRYRQAVKNNDVLALEQIKQDYPEIFTDEFRKHIRESLTAFGVTDAHLDIVYKNAERLTKHVQPKVTLHLVKK